MKILCYKTIRVMLVVGLLASGMVVGNLYAKSSSAPEMSSKQKSLHKQTLQAFRLYHNPEVEAYVDRIGQKMVDHSDHAGRNYHFYLIDDPKPNAFTPGAGLIYVTRGLLVILNSEAELAGVLAHEIGHNVGGHAPGYKARARLIGVGAFIASILAGNSGVGDAIGTASSQKLIEYRRGNELESDEYGSAYLYAANYEPTALMDALSQLAYFGEFFSKLNGGGPTYHAQFSTHPRSDKRLREIIQQAGTLPPGEALIGREEYRKIVDGLIFGDNPHHNREPGFERFLNKKMGITFVYPEGWSKKVDGGKIVLKNPEKTLQFRIVAEKAKDKSLSSEDTLKQKYPENLKSLEPFQKKAKEDLGTMGKAQAKRVGAVRVARNNFYFDGIARDGSLDKDEDKVLTDIMRSFRRAQRSDFPKNDAHVIALHRLEPGESFASLASKQELGALTEQYLRLLNGYYPKGEPEPGTWLKIVDVVPIEEFDPKLSQTAQAN